MFGARLLLPAACLSLAACEIREPGPLPDDRGQVTFWEIVEASQTFAMCTDDPEWREGFGDPQALVGGFISYRLSEDGTTAVNLRCESTDPETCEPADPLRVFEVKSHTLRYEGPVRSAPVVGLDCEQGVKTSWTLVDEGDELALTLTTTHQLTGTATACEALDEIFIGLGSEDNTFGVKSCVVTTAGTAAYRGTR